MERLQKIIASCGICSRRHAEELITQGKVIVNGNVVNELGFKADFNDEIIVDGKKLILENKVYYVLNKPAGYITTVSDTHNRNTVIDLFKDVKERIFPVGRLDQDTTGLLILTNDGDLSNKLIHPRYEIVKEYIALCKPSIDKDRLKILEKGIMLEDGFAKAKEAILIRRDSMTSLVSLKINIGKKHIVKRMIQYLGSEVIQLHRKSLDFLEITDLKPGEYRKLTKEEIDRLKLL